MTMIIVGIDGSEQSQRALTWAIDHARTQGGAVQALMAVPTKNLDGAERTARLEEAERSLARIVAEAVDTEASLPAMTYEVVEGDPSVVMVDATHRADLVVFGSHRMTSIRQTAMGTVSAACIRMGACPVLVIPVGMPEPAPSADLVLA